MLSRRTHRTPPACRRAPSRPLSWALVPKIARQTIPCTFHTCTPHRSHDMNQSDGVINAWTSTCNHFSYACPNDVDDDDPHVDGGICIMNSGALRVLSCSFDHEQLVSTNMEGSPIRYGFQSASSSSSFSTAAAAAAVDASQLSSAAGNVAVVAQPCRITSRLHVPVLGDLGAHFVHRSRDPRGVCHLAPRLAALHRHG